MCLLFEPIVTDNLTNLSSNKFFSFCFFFLITLLLVSFIHFHLSIYSSVYIRVNCSIFVCIVLCFFYIIDIDEPSIDAIYRHRLQVDSTRSKYACETKEVRKRMHVIGEEVERLTLLLQVQDQDKKRCISELDVKKKSLLAMEFERTQMQQDMVRKEEMSATLLSEQERTFVQDLNVVKEQHGQDLQAREAQHEAAMQSMEQRCKEQVETNKCTMEADLLRKIKEMSTVHATELHEMRAKYAHDLHLEREQLGSALVEARSMSDRMLEQTSLTEREKMTLVNKCTRLESERIKERQATMESMFALSEQVENVSKTAEHSQRELRERKIYEENKEREHMISMERYRQVALALETATETLKEDLKSCNIANDALQNVLEQETARRNVAEKLLEEKNVEIRRLTQGVRMKDVATEQAIDRAERAEKRLNSINSRNGAHSRGGAGEKNRQNGIGGGGGGGHLYVDITLNGTTKNNTSNTFSERLEQSLDVAGRQVEELADKEHSLWRRDASFQVWRAEHDSTAVSGSHGDVRADGPLDAVERRLVHLQSRIHDKVNAVASVATPMSVRGRRTGVVNNGEDEDEEVDMDRSFEL